MDLSAIESIFWDFDGVIVDSMTIKNAAFEALFRPFGQKIVDQVLDHHLAYGGISRVHKIERYYRELLATPLSAEALVEKCDEFSSLVVDGVIAADYIPGALEFIEMFHDRIDMTIVSGTPQEELVEIVRRREIDHFFKEVFGSPPKKPERLNEIFNRKKYDRAACLFIGDALTDYNAALETRVPFIAIQGSVTFPENTVVLPDCVNLEEAIASL